MKKLTLRLALVVMALILTVSWTALAEPSDQLRAVYDALTAGGSAFNQSRDMYAQYFEGVTLEAALEDNGITITQTSESEYVESAVWQFVQEGDFLTVTLAPSDYMGVAMAQIVMNAAVSAQGVNTALFNGYISAAQMAGKETELVSYRQEEDGTIRIGFSVAGPYEMPDLDSFVLTEDVLKQNDYEPYGEAYLSRAINFGKISMVANGNADGAQFLVMEYGELDDLAFQAVTSAVKVLQPKGWEAFIAGYTELKDAEGEGYSAVVNADEAAVREIIEAPLEGYSCAIFTIGK